MPTGAGDATQAPGSSPEELATAIREARQAQRRRKKERRLANRRARAGNVAEQDVEDAGRRAVNPASLQTASYENEDSVMTPRVVGGAGTSEVLSLSPVLERPPKAQRTGTDADSTVPIPLGMRQNVVGSISVDSAFGADREQDFSSNCSEPSVNRRQIVDAKPVEGAAGNSANCKGVRLRRRGKHK